MATSARPPLVKNNCPPNVQLEIFIPKLPETPEQQTFPLKSIISWPGLLLADIQYSHAAVGV
jgi:hypothetical protein